jgi:hypothetical protein
MVSDEANLLMPPAKFTREVIEAAIIGFEIQKQQIDARIGELQGMLDGSGAETLPSTTQARQGRRKMNAVARARIAEAQRKRSAESKNQPEAAEPAKPKRRLSRAGRQRIIEATKKRWALKRAEAEAAAKTQQKRNLKTKRAKHASDKRVATKGRAKAPAKKVGRRGAQKAAASQAQNSLRPG